MMPPSAPPFMVACTSLIYDLSNCRSLISITGCDRDSNKESNSDKRYLEFSDFFTLVWSCSLIHFIFYFFVCTFLCFHSKGRREERVFHINLDQRYSDLRYSEVSCLNMGCGTPLRLVT